MARHRQKHLIGLRIVVEPLVGIGVIWVVVQLLRGLPDRLGSDMGRVVMVTGVVAVAYRTMHLLRRAGLRRRFLEKASTAIERQMKSLVRRRAQLVGRDAYGKPLLEKWTQEIDYFITHHIEPSLTEKEQSVLSLQRAAIADLIASRVEAEMRAQPAYRAFSDDMTPAEFEAFCAEELRQAGWDAHVTLQSRDQGVDVVAEKAGLRVVVQCKLYARPVGNKSVQEAAAARAHEHASHGVVVTNNGYTPSAEQLAATNRVLLLHYRDLRNLEGMLQASSFSS